MTKKLFLLDALALVFRAYYALIRVPRFTSSNRNTNAQFGFTNTLIELLTNQKPSHMAVCFDTFAPTVRDVDFADYKANRQQSPEDILSALPDIKRILKGFNIPVIEMDGYEADDIIGTLSKQASAAGYDVYMVTPDKDFGQLVTDKVFIYKPGYQGADAEVLSAKDVCAKWDIKDVDQVKDILGLMGDSVDNIPGIPGVGEKTAAKLLAEYNSLENILDNADSIKGALGEKIRKGKELAIMSKKLATIITDVPVEFHEEDFRVKESNKPMLKEIFAELEFKALGRRVFGEEIPSVQTDLFTSVSKPAEAPSQKDAEFVEEEVAGVIVASQNIKNTKHDYKLAQTDEAIRELVRTLCDKTEICIGSEISTFDPNNAELVGLSFSFEPGNGWYVPFPVNDQDETKRLLDFFEPLFENPFINWVGHNLKQDVLLLKWYNIELKGTTFDTMLAHYVIDPEGKRNIDMLSAQFLGYETISTESLTGKGKAQLSMQDLPTEKVYDYASEDADITLRLKHAFTPVLQAKEVEQVFLEVENPLMRVLADMEFEGIRVDTSFLNEYSKELDREAKTSEEKVYEHAGIRFNLSSPRQLGEVLFEKLKLDPKAKKTKTGQYATGEDVLSKLAATNEIVNDILTYRQLTKLKSTYVDALPLMINSKTGRVHTSFAQAVAVTGRLSSINPNLQNIPIRTERGREIRKAFIPRDKDHIILSADYSQIELRIVAAISGDPAMIEAFVDKRDIHNATAAKVYGIEETAVTKEQRYKAKSVNFGIIYGQGAFGLADNLSISRSEAKEIIENYKKEFSSIQKYMDSTINFAKEHGYVKTLMGRKRWLKDINSGNFTVRSFAERNAINSPIQGTAADMIKMAMIKINHEFRSRKLKSRMVLQVHDELVFDAHRDEAEMIKPVIIDCMRSALPLPNGVPVEAEIGGGENWLEAH